jgi:hypothetical protein
MVPSIHIVAPAGNGTRERFSVRQVWETSWVLRDFETLELLFQDRLYGRALTVETSTGDIVGWQVGCHDQVAASSIDLIAALVVELCGCRCGEQTGGSDRVTMERLPERDAEEGVGQATTRGGVSVALNRSRESGLQ